METTQAVIGEWLGKLHLPTILRAFFYVGAGYVFAKLAGLAIKRWFKGLISSHHSMLLNRMVFYLIFGLFAVSALWELGFSLELLIGAAGIFTVALGFASQTSASNLISGIFLLTERPFSVDDTVRIGDTLGEVISIDLMSVKLRTFDNLFVRIPNETLIKSEITTLTKFPIRRIDIRMGVAYKENLETVRDILFEIADKNPKCLDNPKPLFFFRDFGSSSLDIQFSVWTRQEGFIKTKTKLMMEIKQVFDEKGIEIPFPHVTLYSGSKTNPMPISIERNNDGQINGSEDQRNG